MFQSARLKLTAWYLLIIMLISVVFSVVIYTSTTRDIQRVIHRMEHEQQDPFDRLFPHPLPQISIQDLEGSEQRLLLTLIFINGLIFVLAGGLGYFLAGRTLQPIKTMVDEQNRFITDASHELRTPLTVLKSEIEVSLRDKELKLSHAKALLSSNLEEVNNLQVLSDNLLQLAQFHKPNNHFAFEDVSLLIVLPIAEKKIHALAKQKEISIAIPTKDYTIVGQKESLIQLFVILLENAIKYSPEKSSVSITAKATDHKVLIQVADQGVGIDKKDIPHIFDRFYRADSSRTKQTAPGYGLGLSIAKKIVETHQGIIDVKSEVGKGTTFTIQLPQGS